MFIKNLKGMLEELQRRYNFQPQVVKRNLMESVLTQKNSEIGKIK